MLTVLRSSAVDRLCPVAWAFAGGFACANTLPGPAAASAERKAKPEIHCFVFMIQPFSTPAHSYSVNQFDFRTWRERHVEDEGARIFSGRRQASGQDLPVAPRGFVHLHALGRVLVVTQLDLPRAFAGAGAQRTPAELAAIGHDIEGFAELDANLLVARRVLDRILSDELLLAALVGLVDAHRTLRQRHAQLVLLLVLQIQIHAYFLVLHHVAVVAAEPLRRAKEDQFLVERDVGSRQQADLLLLFIE